MKYTEYKNTVRKYELLNLLIQKASEDLLIQHLTNEHVETLLQVLKVHVKDDNYLAIEVFDYPEDFAEKLKAESFGTMGSGVSLNHIPVIGEIDKDKPDFDITKLNIFLTVRVSNMNGAEERSYFLNVLFPHSVPEPTQEVENLMHCLS